MPPFPRREFSGNAVPTTVTSAIDNAALTINIASATGWPTGATGPFIVTIDQGLATEEKIEVANRTGLVLTATPTGRGHDNTAAVGHGPGAPIEHTMAARDLSEANAHAADQTRDDHPQYFNAARHLTEVHVISTGELEDAAVTYVKLAAGQRWEPGDFKWSFVAADHTGWLLTDGREVSLTTYPGLTPFAGMWGAAAAGFIKLPDMRKRMAVGKAAAGTASTLGGTGGSADAVAVAHAHVINEHTHTTGNDTPDHAHNANHGHTADDNTAGEHRHGIGGDMGSRFAVSHGAAVNSLTTPAAERATFSAMDLAGGHDHNITVNANNFNTAGATVRHNHGNTGGASDRNTNSVGQAATDANLPPWMAMNGFIHT